MRAFLAGVAMLVAISVAAWLALESFERPSSEVFQVDESVRL
jgi:hypothetical protein